MFDFHLFFFLLSVLFLLTASYFDIKKRIIPNYIILYFLMITLLSKITQSLFLGFGVLFNSLLAFIISFIIFFLIWHLGIIAGGDVKLFLILSLINPFSISYFYNSTSYFPLFSFYLFILSLICILPYTLSVGIFKTFKYKILLKDILSLDDFYLIINTTILLFLVNTFITLIFNTNIYVLFIVSLTSIFLLNKIKEMYTEKYLITQNIIFLILIIIDLFFLDLFSLRSLSTLFIFLLFFKLLFSFIKIISYNLIKIKTINELEEGDVLFYNIYKSNNKYYKKKVNLVSMMILTIKNTYYKDLIIDSNKSGGLNALDINLLKTLYKDNLIEQKIKVKDTLPFTPSVLIAYLLSTIIGGKFV